MSSSIKGTMEDNPLHFTKHAENYLQHEVKALRAALKESEKRLEETDQCLLALETKFDSFSHEPRENNKRKKPAKKYCDYCKKTGKWAQGHDESVCLHKQRDDAGEKLQTITERRAKRRAGRVAGRN